MAEQADFCSVASWFNCHMAPLRMDRLLSDSFHLPFPHTVFGNFVLVVQPLLLCSQVSILTSVPTAVNLVSVTIILRISRLYNIHCFPG